MNCSPQPIQPFRSNVPGDSIACAVYPHSALNRALRQSRLDRAMTAPSVAYDRLPHHSLRPLPRAAQKPRDWITLVLRQSAGPSACFSLASRHIASGGRGFRVIPGLARHVAYHIRPTVFCYGPNIPTMHCARYLEDPAFRTFGG